MRPSLGTVWLTDRCAKRSLGREPKWQPGERAICVRLTVASSRCRNAPAAWTQRRDSMATGTVKWFNETKGYGFIQPDQGGRDVFVHVSAVERSGMRGLA